MHVDHSSKVLEQIAMLYQIALRVDFLWRGGGGGGGGGGVSLAISRAGVLAYLHSYF